MNNSVIATLQIRNGPAANWTTRNPILTIGEYGLENDTFLIKVGDGIHHWNDLPYLNKLDATYFTRHEDGSLTFSSTFAETINNIIINSGGSAHIVINNDPVAPTDPVNLRYLQWAIEHAGHLKRSVVEYLPTENIDENTLYMVLASSGDHYEEYMYINNSWDMVGTTGDGGSSGSFVLEVATTARLGGVKASVSADYVNVTPEGFMTVNQVSTSKLYVPTGDTLIIYGGNA